MSTEVGRHQEGRGDPLKVLNCGPNPDMDSGSLFYLQFTIWSIPRTMIGWFSQNLARWFTPARGHILRRCIQHFGC